MTDRINPIVKSGWRRTARSAMFCAFVSIPLCPAASAQTYEENLAKGAETTEQN